MIKKLKHLRKLNLLAAAAHFIQGTLVLILSRDFTLPVTTDHLSYYAQNGTNGTLLSSQSVLFDISLPLLIALFFYMSALAHLIIATVYRQTYEVNLAKGINKARWFEYALSASVMIVAISLLVGVYDISILVSVFVLTSAMNLMGLVMEVTNVGQKKPNWLSYSIGVYVGMVPWAIIAFYFWASSYYGNASPPNFVYWIFVSIFLFFSSFALNMWLQYSKIGRWQEYLYGEKGYIVLSLVAKSALAWQVFAGTLRP